MYLQQGRTEEATAVLYHYRSRYKDLYDPGDPMKYSIPLSFIYALLGQKEKALKHMEEIYTNDIYNMFWDQVQNDYLLKDLYNKPEFQTIINKAQAKRAKMRAVVRKMEKQGKIDL